MKTHITYSHNGLLSVGHDPREAENVIYNFADRFLPPFRFVSSLFVSVRLCSSLDSTRTTDPTDQIRRAHTTLTQSSQPQDSTFGRRLTPCKPCNNNKNKNFYAATFAAFAAAAFCASVSTSATIA